MKHHLQTLMIDFLLHHIYLLFLLILVNNNQRNYLIFLHGTNTIVGSISYRGYHVSDYSGDVEAFIIPYYRGCGYAYEALRLLSHLLFEANIFDFWVSAYRDNFASIKTIEKFEHKIIIPSSHNDNNIILYECKTYTDSIDKKLKLML